MLPPIPSLLTLTNFLVFTSDVSKESMLNQMVVTPRRVESGLIHDRELIFFINISQMHRLIDVIYNV